MPTTKKGYRNTSGIAHQTADGVFYVNGRYLCQKVENGALCNREIAATRHSISSHNSDFHTPGRYQQLMAKGDYKCTHDGCNHRSENFQAILAHVRKAHKFRGSSDPLKLHYGISVGTRRKSSINIEGNRRNKKTKQHNSQGTLQTVKEDDHEDTSNDTQELTREVAEEDCHEKSGREAGNDSDSDGGDEEGLLGFIDPHLRKWDEDNGPGNGGAGSGGSGLGGQLLSSNVIAAGE